MTASRTDWYDWHDLYDRSDSMLGQRLEVVQEYLNRELYFTRPGPIQLVSMCAGQGRDVVGALADHPRAPDVRGRLVELDSRNAAAASAGLHGIGAKEVEVVVADAGFVSSYTGAIPADILLLCGVFGNVSDDDVARTIRELPGLSAPGASVVWTRARVEPDPTFDIRRWFAEAGFEEIDFVTVGEGMGVGLHRFAAEPAAPPNPDTKLFDFVGFDALRPGVLSAAHAAKSQELGK